MAREVHDVIAHCMSVMVVQTTAARSVGPQDLGAHERRWARLGLSQLDVLADRARAAGLPVEMDVDDARPALSPGLDLVAYRPGHAQGAGRAQCQTRTGSERRERTARSLARWRVRRA
jgi:Histidine kinase